MVNDLNLRPTHHVPDDLRGSNAPTFEELQLNKRSLYLSTAVIAPLFLSGCSSDQDVFDRAWARAVDTHASRSLDIEVITESGLIPDAQDVITGTAADVDAKQKEIDAARAEAVPTICDNMVRDLDRKPLETILSDVQMAMFYNGDSPNLGGSDELRQFIDQVSADIVTRLGEAPEFTFEEDSPYRVYQNKSDELRENAWATQARDALREERDKLQAETEELLTNSVHYVIDRCDINIPGK